jgi:hypothetical protein
MKVEVGPAPAFEGAPSSSQEPGNSRGQQRTASSLIVIIRYTLLKSGFELERQNISQQRRLVHISVSEESLAPRNREELRVNMLAPLCRKP